MYGCDVLCEISKRAFGISHKISHSYIKSCKFYTMLKNDQILSDIRAFLKHHPTNGTSIEFKMQSKFGVLWFKACSTNHNKILHTP